MPRGRPPRASTTPAKLQTVSDDASPVAKSGTSESPATESLVKRPRGRPSRSSLLADTSSAAVESPTTSATSSRTTRGQAKALAIASESVSSATPNAQSSESGYSTPNTSTVPTPITSADLSFSIKSQKGVSIEVQVPSKTTEHNRERALRNSMYAMKPAGPKDMIDDSEDEGVFSDTSPDAQVARRLQQQEYTRAEASHVRPSGTRRSGRISGVGAVDSGPGEAGPSTAPELPPLATMKRTRSSASLNGPLQTKKTKVIPDSEDTDMETESQDEIAAFDELTELTSPPASDSEDDLPLSRNRKRLPRRNAAGPARTRARTSNAVVEDSEEDVPLSTRRRTTTRSSREADLAELPEDQPTESEVTSYGSSAASSAASASNSDAEVPANTGRVGEQRRAYRVSGNQGRVKKERNRLEANHPEIKTMWKDLEAMPVLKAGRAPQPHNITRQLKPFQLEGLAWMTAMEKTEWAGGLLGDEMGLGKTIQAVSLVMSDYPAKQPSLVLVPPVALMQWQSEIKAYTDGTLNTFVYHGTNQKSKSMTLRDLKKFDVIMMSYNSLESMYRKQEKGFKRKDGIHKEKSLIHSIHFHRVILDEAHCIKTRTTMTAKACFALTTDYRWCLTGTPLQNRIGEFFSLIRFLNIRPFASYLCKQCPCSQLEWTMDEFNRCTSCKHAGMQHVSVFNQELLNPIQQYGNLGPGREAFRKLRLMTDRIMLRRLKKDHTNSMELPVKEIYVDRQFFGEEENDFSNSIMTNGKRRFDTYVAQGVLLNNYANIFGLIMQMRQVADHPDLILKKNAEGGQNVMVCCICDESAEDAVRSRCKHDFCRACVASYIRSTDEPDCPRCHIPLSIDLEQAEIEQDESLVKKSSIINRIKMENWKSSSKIELLVHELHKLRSDNATHKSIIFSQFTTMLQLIEWRLRRAGITTVMLDGSMTPAQRQASIEHFMNNVDVECFLVSLKAGGVALNLTEASRVFIVDPWWNPAAEWQSADRCHRIGQTRPCAITRLCIEDSVESRMVLIQEKKTSMIHSTVNADDKAMDSLSPEDLQFLFRGS
ncbi:SNF2 family N-terminal domain-containing protein [Stachybotrys elegans]|uniref:SNF2 family N-terminal domain-containing protein n=1 Tax=Stachybotrys elegans TaxID=80388 RepID=A0A8K0WRM7_9HYPO|nr:SNF2 family N-terminal domain-containing protein [Stachybotrys elegans]